MTASFAEFGLAAPLARALEGAGYVTPTPIQAQAIPHLIEGKDLLGLAQTGTGKTAAFVLPILQRLRSAGSRPEAFTARALILAPTRELAIQIHETVKILSKGQHFAHASVFGGVSINPQIDALKRGLDILIATPGRLMDLIQQRKVDLRSVSHFVLDEADRMLDMGFIRDVKKIVALLPKDRQSMLFSATMPETIGEIASTLLRNPVTIEVRPEAVPMDRIAQHLVHLPISAKRDALLKVLSARDVTRAMVFARTKHGANRLTDHLTTYGLKAVVIHGNKSQGARQKALAEFKAGQATILVATDIAARGIDVADVSHVVNAELPDEPESYVHRIGRTARAGRAGVAITLCAPEEKDKLKAVERLIRRSLPVMVLEGVDLANAKGANISDERQPRGQRPARGRRPEGGARHGARPQSSRDQASRDAAPRRDEPRRQDPHRDDARRDDMRRDDGRREERRAQPERRFDDRPRNGQARFGDAMPARGEARRPDGARQDQKRQDQKRAEHSRPDEKRSEPQRVESRREAPKGERRGERAGLLPAFIAGGRGRR
jgi:ATP-dependent RNA helicase RhlE